MKEKIRREILLKRKNQDLTLKKEKDSKIRKNILKSSHFKKAKNILFYMPIHGEPDTLPIIEMCLLKHKVIYLPRTEEKTHTLHIHETHDLNKLIEGKYKLKEPHHESKVIKPELIDLVFVPGIAFSKTGHRIGFGKGFFDRLLKKTQCYTIGLAYDFQMVENIPAEPHDVPVDEIITESKTIKTSNTI